MGKHKQVECKICVKTMRSDTIKGHMKVHEKYEVKIQTNEEMCRELVMDLVDNVIDKDTITCRNEDLSEKPHGLKRTYDVISQSSTESYSINVEKLRKSIMLQYNPIEWIVKNM